MVEFSIDGDVTIAGSRILVPVSIASVIGGVLVPVSGTVTSIAGGTVPIGVQQSFVQTNVKTNAGLIASGAATVSAGTLQDMVLDAVYGTVVSGSIQSAIVGVEPQSGARTSTIVSGAWFTGTVQTGQRIQAVGPLGAQVAVVWNVPSGSVQGVYLTAQQSATD